MKQFIQILIRIFPSVFFSPQCNTSVARDIYVSICVYVGKRKKYDSSLSNDYREDGRRFKITYGSGGVVGFTSIDTIKVSILKM